MMMMMTKRSFVFVALVSCLLAMARAQMLHPCEASGGCCFGLDWQRWPGTSGVDLSEGYEVAQTLELGPWGSSSGMGIRVALDDSVTRPGLLGWRYPLALLNVSCSLLGTDWSGLLDPDKGLALVPAEAVLPRVSPVRSNWKMHIYFSPSKPACLKHVSLLRTYTMAVRQGASIEVSLLGERVFLRALTVHVCRRCLIRWACASTIGSMSGTCMWAPTASMLCSPLPTWCVSWSRSWATDTAL